MAEKTLQQLYALAANSLTQSQKQYYSQIWHGDDYAAMDSTIGRHWRQQRAEVAADPSREEEID